MSTEKNRPPTGKRLAELREKGNIPKSQDIPTTVIMAIFLFGLLYYGYYFSQEMGRYMVSCFTEIAKFPSRANVIGSIPGFIDSYLMFAIIILSIVLMVAAYLSHALQTGIVFQFNGLISFDVSKFNPVTNLQNLFKPQRLVMTASSFLKLGIIVIFTIAAAQELLSSKVFIGAVSPQELGEFYAIVAWSVGWRVLVALVIISVLDFLYQKWQFMRDSRMSDQEIKDEGKQAEGDPEVKSKQKSLRLKARSMRRMIENMQDSTIVITNPTHYAIALKYVRDETPAPIVIAKGMNRNARRIRERAESLGIELHENKSLAQGLYKHGEIGKAIPAMYFQIVAQILAELFRRGYHRI